MELQSPATQFELLIPRATKWAAEQEQRILRDGVPLSDAEASDAREVGVKHPERVRLLQVDAVPSPTDPMLKAACAAANFVPQSPRGLTIGHGVFVRSDYWGNRALLLHELVHTAQYERLGGIEPFLRRYLYECATVGYTNSTMESEAAATAARILPEA